MNWAIVSALNLIFFSCLTITNFVSKPRKETKLCFHSKIKRTKYFRLRLSYKVIKESFKSNETDWEKDEELCALDNLSLRQTEIVTPRAPGTQRSQKDHIIQIILFRCSISLDQWYPPGDTCVPLHCCIKQAWLALVLSSNDFQMSFAFELWVSEDNFWRASHPLSPPWIRTETTLDHT